MAVNLLFYTVKIQHKITTPPNKLYICMPNHSKINNLNEISHQSLNSPNASFDLEANYQIFALPHLSMKLLANLEQLTSVSDLN